LARAAAFVVLMLPNSTGWVSSEFRSGASSLSQAFLTDGFLTATR